MIQFTKKVSILGIILVVSCLGIGVGQNLSRQTSQFQFARAVSAFADATPRTTGQQNPYELLELENKVRQFIKAHYVDEVKDKVLIEGAIKGMMEQLDPHSNFLSAEVYKDMQIDTSGKFGGLGIEIGMKDNILTVLAPIEDTPAWKAGLKPFDRIVKINNETTKGMSLVEAVNKMRGKPKTPVTLSIYRSGWSDFKDLTIVRDIIKIQSVKSDMLEPGYGYVRLTTFNESAAADVKKAIEAMQKKGKLKGIVFDLRMNPGGLLDQAVEVASLFVDSDKDGNALPIVSTIGRNRENKDVKYAHKGQAFKNLPVAVLVNSSTASAAEIVAGALQDYRRAIIMGQPTFGKGSVQTVIPLPPDMGLKLTIARYYTPSGRSIQEKGVQPDIVLDDYDPKLLAQAKLKLESFREVNLKGHMANPDEDGSGSKETPKDSSYDLKDTQNSKDFKKDELDALTKDKKKGEKGSKEDDEMAPMKLNPKEDYQVGQALLILKSGDVFKKTLGIDMDVASEKEAKDIKDSREAKKSDAASE